MSEIIKAHVLFEDMQDGSASITLFPSVEEMEEYAENIDQRFCEDTCTMEFTVEDGLLKPVGGWPGKYEE